MLETIREFAEERLAEAGELEPMRRRLIEWAYEFALSAEPGWHAADGQMWFVPFRLELDNLRQAMRWAIDAELHEHALGTAAYLAWLWIQQGPVSEGREWVEQALAAGPRPQDVGLEGYALLVLVDLGARRGGDFDEDLLRRSLRLLERGGRRHAHAYGCFLLAGHLVRRRGSELRDLAEPETLLAAIDSTARALADPVIELLALELGAELAIRKGDHARGRALCERLLATAVTAGQPYNQAVSLVNLARIECAVGDLDRARSLLAEARAIAERDHLSLAAAAAYNESALVELVNGDADEAAAYLAKTEASAEQLGARGAWLASIGLLEAAVQASRGDDARAVESWSRADHLREGWEWDIDEQVVLAQILEPLRERLPDDEFARHWQRGRNERSSARI
jgi:tetratricopeptide (TPR) repeat protein